MGSQEAHVFDEVSASSELSGVAQVADLDVNGRCRLVRLRVLHEQRLEPIRQPEEPVRPVVKRRNLERLAVDVVREVGECR